MNKSNWLHEMPGRMLWTQESSVLERMLKGVRGDFLLQMSAEEYAFKNGGWFKTQCILNSKNISAIDKPAIQADLSQLPIESDAIDVALLIHQLEIVSQPEKVIAEITRILKPNGRIIIVCFNLFGMWKLFQFFQNRKSFPWSGSFYRIGKIKKWLLENDCQVTEIRTIGFRPPMTHAQLTDHLFFMETLGQLCCPNSGAVFILSAYKKIPGMTVLPMLEREKKLRLRSQMVESPIPTQPQDAN